MAKALEELFPHKFSVGDTVKVVARGESEWCKVGDTHKVRVCRHDHEDGAVYVVDDDHESAYIRECNLELVERDRQKVGEWKRHRGGKQPVADDVRVEVKLRDGDIQEARARAFLWHHNQCDSYANIMKYRVISQPQAEEVGSISESVHKPIIEAFNSMAAEWHEDQIDCPIKWRDTVNELDAYIEEFTREREALINRLALEGFALLPAMHPVFGVSDLDMSDWRNWKKGDMIECVYSTCSGVYHVGGLYYVNGVYSTHADVQDDCGVGSSCNIADKDFEDVQFIRRP